MSLKTETRENPTVSQNKTNKYLQSFHFVIHHCYAPYFMVCECVSVEAARTYEEGVGGTVTCQQLHRLWVKPEPKSHSQHQQARQLRSDQSYHH